MIITTPEDKYSFRNLLGNGDDWGLNLAYAEQPKPAGLAQAFTIGEEFIGTDRVCLILGDNIFYGNRIEEKLRSAVAYDSGATVLCVVACMMLIMFEQRYCGYSAGQHDQMYLTFGDFEELLARAAKEYFKSSIVCKELHEQLRLVIEHVHLTTTTRNPRLEPLKEPQKKKQKGDSAPAGAPS